MVVEPEIEQSATSVTPYVKELEAIYGRHGVSCGTPGELRAGSERLSKKGSLADEVSATLRSVIYREHETLAEADLLQLLATSLGGPEVDLRSPEYQEGVGHLRTFLAGALRSFWRSSPTAPYQSRLTKKAPESIMVAESAPDTPVREGPGTSHGAIAERLPLEQHPLEDANIAENQRTVAAEVARMMERDRLRNGSREPARFIEEVVVLDDRAPVQIATASSLVAERHAEVAQNTPSRPFVRTSSQAFQDAKAGPVASSPERTGHNLRIPQDEKPASTTRVAEDAEQEGLFPEYRSLKLISPEHRTLWIVGILALLLGILIGVLLHGRRQAETAKDPTAAPSTQSVVPAHPLPRQKPSPYGFTAAMASAKHLKDSPATVRVAGQDVAQAPSARYSPEEDGLDDPATRAAGSTVPVPKRVSSSAGHAVFLSASGVMAGNLLIAPAPAYPASASASGIQGKVVIQALVGRDGHVLDTHIISGDPRLCDAAVNAVSRWRYRPFVANGRPSQIETTATLDFRLFQ